MALISTGVTGNGLNRIGKHCLQFRWCHSLDELVWKQGLSEAEEYLLNPQEMTLTFRRRDKTWTSPCIIGEIGVANELNGRVLLSALAFLDENGAPL